MTENRKIDMLRNMIDGSDEDDGVLSVYLQLAGDKILNRMYPYLDNYDGLSVPDRYTSVQLKIAAYELNKRGAEGQIQHIDASGTHRNYGSADIPDAMLQEVVPFCRPVR